MVNDPFFNECYPQLMEIQEALVDLDGLNKKKTKKMKKK